MEELKKRLEVLDSLGWDFDLDGGEECYFVSDYVGNEKFIEKMLEEVDILFEKEYGEGVLGDKIVTFKIFEKKNNLDRNVLIKLYDDIDEFVRSYVEIFGVIEDCECWEEYRDEIKKFVLNDIKKEFNIDYKWEDIDEDIRLDFWSDRREEWDEFVFDSTH